MIVEQEEKQVSTIRVLLATARVAAAEGTNPVLGVLQSACVEECVPVHDFVPEPVNMAQYVKKGLVYVLRTL